MASDQGQAGAGGTTQQVKEKGQEMVSQAQQQVQEKAQVVRGKAGDRLREQVNQRSTQVGEQTQSLAGTVRQTAEQLRNDGKDGQAGVAEQAADRVERVGTYLRDSDADTILSNVEDFARRRPWLVGGAGALLGFLASRFLKASSGKRYESREPRYGAEYGTYEGTYPAATYAGGTRPDVPSRPVGATDFDESGTPYVTGTSVVDETDRGAL
jgi:ElaB/YqjD/DUF883 family membrane-anchored ribosome-binding protein